MQPHIYVSWSASELRIRLAPWNRLKPSSKIFYWPFQGRTSFVDFLCFFSILCLLCLCARLFICALWPSAWKELTFWLSFVVSNFEFVTFPLVPWVRCGTWLYWFLIFAPLLTLSEWASCMAIENVINGNQLKLKTNVHGNRLKYFFCFFTHFTLAYCLKWMFLNDNCKSE